MDVTDQAGLDRRMIQLDGTPNKGRLGANADLALAGFRCREMVKNEVVDRAEGCSDKGTH